MAGQTVERGTGHKAWFRAGDAPCPALTATPPRVYRLVLLGPPGVGKGTQAELLCQRLHTCHLSTGDVFRAAKNDDRPSPAMAAALAAMNRGELVSDELTIAMVRERLRCLACPGGFLLDGFPRTLPQAQALSAMLGEQGVALDAVLSYELPLAEIVERLGGRRTCPGCKAVYHVTTRPPAVPSRCDQCGGDLVQRDDDRPESIRVRMNAYAAETAPLRNYYAARGELIPIPAAGPPEEILALTLGRL